MSPRLSSFWSQRNICVILDLWLTTEPVRFGFKPWGWGYLAPPWSRLHTSWGRWALRAGRRPPGWRPGSWTRKRFLLSGCPPKHQRHEVTINSRRRSHEGARPHRADPLGDGGQVDLLPHQRVGVALVDVVGVDLGAAAVFGALPGQSHGGAVAAQHGDSIRSAGGRCESRHEQTTL